MFEPSLDISYRYTLMTMRLAAEENKIPLSERSVIIFAFLISAFILLLILNLIVRISSAEHSTLF